MSTPIHVCPSNCACAIAHSESIGAFSRCCRPTDPTSCPTCRERWSARGIHSCYPGCGCVTTDLATRGFYRGDDGIVRRAS